MMRRRRKGNEEVAGYIADLQAQIRRLQGIAADVREAERTAEHWEGLWTVAIERAEAAEVQVTENAAEIRRLRRGNRPAGPALRSAPPPYHDVPSALQEALTERDAEHEGAGGEQPYGPGAICDTCGHLAGRHNEDGCQTDDLVAKGIREKPCPCSVMRWLETDWPRPWLPAPEGLTTP